MTGGLVAVHAHPDDESLSTGALLATWARAGLPTTVVTCTRGERGEVIGAASRTSRATVRPWPRTGHRRARRRAGRTRRGTTTSSSTRCPACVRRTVRGLGHGVARHRPGGARRRGPRRTRSSASTSRTPPTGSPTSCVRATAGRRRDLRAWRRLRPPRPRPRPRGDPAGASSSSTRHRCCSSPSRASDALRAGYAALTGLVVGTACACPGRCRTAAVRRGARRRSVDLQVDVLPGARPGARRAACPRDPGAGRPRGRRRPRTGRLLCAQQPGARARCCPSRPTGWPATATSRGRRACAG